MKSKESNNPQNHYDDGDIPEVDLPKDKISNSSDDIAQGLPESFRPRKDGPGGE